MNKNVLIIDDEEAQANIIANILEKEGFSVEKGYSAEEALNAVGKKEFSVMLVDLKMPGMGGLAFLKQIKEQGSNANVIIMTAYGTIETAVEAMKNGAFDYITKPFGKDELLINMERAINAFNLYHQNIRLKEELETLYEGQKIIGKSEAIQRIHELIQKVADTENANVLITGESGTGKELVARAIHGNSRRYDMPFVAVNCSAIPVNLLESELFGYEKGAFTGAVSRREGKFKRANGGSLFLDEIADMPLNMQAKLLRVIQDGEVTPVGGDDPERVDIRIISATNSDIGEVVKRGAFRDDLFYRLNVVPIHIPSLRERREDIPVLIEHIKNNLNRKLKKNIENIPEEILNRLKTYHFPGNIRELENIMERAFILADNNRLSVELFPLPEHASQRSSSIENGLSLKDISKQAREEVERDVIVNVLNETNWNRVKTAHILKVDYKTLRQKIKELNISPQYGNGRRA
ncbi:MAG: sigma-54-dependent Fis family transcriptional regulator [Spirochaetes bacterium]|nr:sigma-54-dependent Fis family transcriptional regulator [Spirochaetota bacterium]